MPTYRVGYFVGSLSSTSINRVLSKALIRVAPPDLEFTEIPIGRLPLYSQDYDDDYPPEAMDLKAAFSSYARFGETDRALLNSRTPSGAPASDWRKAGLLAASLLGSLESVNAR